MVYRSALALGLFAFAAFAAVPAKPTFSKDIVPIFQEKCQECHHTGSMAPMSLVSYEETRPWAKSIKQRVATHQMPPWHLDKTVGISHFSNDRSLNDDQIETIVRWVDNGSPLGDPKDAPQARVFSDDNGWKLAASYGQPDMVIKSADYTMPAHGQDVWFKPETDINLPETRWVRAVEMRPGTMQGRRIMHHVLANLIQDEPGEEMAQGPGLLMEWAVGKNYDIYRKDSGKLLLPGSKIRWELHIHAVGEEIRDHAELAVYLYPKGEIPKNRVRLQSFWAFPIFGGAGLDIPPNTQSSTIGYHVLPHPARLENFQPHMHLRGKAMEMEALLPDGSSQVLSYVNNFNFNWMTNYIYADDSAPVLPKGTVIKITAWYDNTRTNPNNPDPDQWVGFGDRTVDEMGHAWVNVTYLSDQDYADWLSKHKPERRGRGATAQQ
jgi:hypothetical protein